jgi:hypothetical protein
MPRSFFFKLVFGAVKMVTDLHKYVYDFDVRAGGTIISPLLQIKFKPCSIRHEDHIKTK